MYINKSEDIFTFSLVAMAVLSYIGFNLSQTCKFNNVMFAAGSFDLFKACICIMDTAADYYHLFGMCI